MTSRRRRLLFIVAALLILVGCYGLLNGYGFIGIIFSGAGMIINISQLLYRLPLGRGLSDTTSERRLVLPPSYTVSKQRENTGLLTDFIRRFSRLLLGPSENEKRLILPAYYVAQKKIEKRQRSIELTISAALMLLPVITLVLYYTDIVGAPQGYCTVLTKHVEAHAAPALTYPDLSAAAVIIEFDIVFTFRLHTTDGHIYPVVDGSNGQGGYSQQDAEEQLKHYHIGQTYACKYRHPLNPSTWAWLISDQPISLPHR